MTSSGIHPVALGIRTFFPPRGMDPARNSLPADTRGTIPVLAERIEDPRVHHAFLDDVLVGLSRRPRHLPCKYLYDERGSQLFEQICDLPEYYLTRCEIAILEEHASEITSHFGPDCGLIEYGSGSSRKTRLLLERLPEAVYFPVDINRRDLERTAKRLSREHPRLEVVPIGADFTQPFALPSSRRPIRRKIVYFSGSTIGNFSPHEAVRLLQQMARLVGPRGGLLLGYDRKKDRSLLEPAYDDARGVTAAFNLNLLVRMNRELGANFVVERFRHRARYDEVEGRVEMHLVSQTEQEVQVGERGFHFGAGESICTEHSYKYDSADIHRLAERAGLRPIREWRDGQDRFCLVHAEPFR